MVPSNSSMPSQ
jgi:hypothetical protein